MRSLKAASLAVALIALPGTALAHPGHEAMSSSFVSGLLHPITGVDHLAAMLMVGLWAGLVMPTRLWVAPTTFVASMLAGFAYANGGGVLPMTEGLIMASLVVFGLSLWFAVRAPIGLAVSIIGLLAFAHGHAHGTEFPYGSGHISFAWGFTIATCGLHIVGLAVARIATRPASRAMGLLGAGGGVLILLS